MANTKTCELATVLPLDAQADQQSILVRARSDIDSLTTVYDEQIQVLNTWHMEHLWRIPPTTNVDSLIRSLDQRYEQKRRALDNGFHLQLEQIRNRLSLQQRTQENIQRLAADAGLAIEQLGSLHVRAQSDFEGFVGADPAPELDAAEVRSAKTHVMHQYAVSLLQVMEAVTANYVQTIGPNGFTPKATVAPSISIAGDVVRQLLMEPGPNGHKE